MRTRKLLFFPEDSPRVGSIPVRISRILVLHANLSPVYYQLKS
jgi:hypothetical protein